MDSTAIQLMDLTSLKAVVAELRHEILPSRFEKAQQPESNTLQIGLRTLKGLIWLEISWQADAPRLVQIPPPAKQGGESTLAKQVQHGLYNLALTKIIQEDFERVIRFELAPRPGENVKRILVLELMGRHSNFLLLDNTQKIIAIGRQIRKHQSRVRPISTGDLYLPPPPLIGIKPDKNESFTSWKERLSLIPTTLKDALKNTYQGMSPQLMLQLTGENKETALNLLKCPIEKLSNKKWEYLYNRWSIWLTRLDMEQLGIWFKGPTTYRNWDTEIPNSSSLEGISINLGKYYRDNLNKKTINRVSKDLHNSLKKSIKNEETSLNNQRDLLISTYQSGDLKKEADEILAKPFPQKDDIEKAQSLYKRSKKLRRSISILKERIVFHEERIKMIKETELFLENISETQWETFSEKLKLIMALKKDFYAHFSRRKQPEVKKKSTKDRQPVPLEILSPKGLLIQIGRNHRQNEWISIRKAKNGDIWFHAQECPGSHVVLKSSSGLAEEKDLQMAADLAAFFSRAKGNAKVPVFMVPVERLKKIPNAMPGTVSHSEGKVCWGKPTRIESHLAATLKRTVNKSSTN